MPIQTPHLRPEHTFGKFNTMPVSVCNSQSWGSSDNRSDKACPVPMI